MTSDCMNWIFCITGLMVYGGKTEKLLWKDELKLNNIEIGPAPQCPWPYGLFLKSIIVLLILLKTEEV